MTAGDLINDVFSLLQVYAPGEPIAAADSATALFTLQAIVDGWQAEPLTITSTVILTFQTAAGKGSYTLGPALTNNWVSPFLPPEITSYGAMLAGNLEIGLTPLTDTQWAGLGLKSLGSTIALGLWPQYGPLSHTLWVWPVPSAIEPIVLYCPQPVANFVSLSDAVVLRPGYLEPLTYELAIKVSPKFGSAAILPSWLPQAWALSKTRMKEANFPILDARCDPALVGKGGGKGGAGLIDFYLGR